MSKDGTSNEVDHFAHFEQIFFACNHPIWHDPTLAEAERTRQMIRGMLCSDCGPGPTLDDLKEIEDKVAPEIFKNAVKRYLAKTYKPPYEWVKQEREKQSATPPLSTPSKAGRPKKAKP